MGQVRKRDKITKVSVPEITSGTSYELRAASYESFDLGCFALPSRTFSEPVCSKLISSKLAAQPYFAVTSECVIACTDKAIRFCTPTLRINLAT